MKKQELYYANLTPELFDVLVGHRKENPLLVCGNSFKGTAYYDDIKCKCKDLVEFGGFSPNPKYEEVCDGVDCYKNNNCDCIVAIGGGSAIDVAKSIKAFCTMDAGQSYLDQKIKDNGVLLIAVPTTAGTGSESTKYSVIYKDDVKQSVADPCLVPDIAILDEKFLLTLPKFQKACTLMDALCQAIESYWSVGSTVESKDLACQAIKLIIENYESYYFDNNVISARRIMEASNIAGQAIDITATTAPHAMSYKLTSIYGIPHGYAVGASLPFVWDYMNRNIEKCSDSRGKQYLISALAELAKIVSSSKRGSGIDFMLNIMNELLLDIKVISNEEDIDVLVDAVNIERLGNNPVELDKEALAEIYSKLKI